MLAACSQPRRGSILAALADLRHRLPPVTEVGLALDEAGMRDAERHCLPRPGKRLGGHAKAPSLGPAGPDVRWAVRWAGISQTEARKATDSLRQLAVRGLGLVRKRSLSEESSSTWKYYRVYAPGVTASSSARGENWGIWHR